MSLFPDKQTIKLLRIPFSFFLMPVFLLAWSQAVHPEKELVLYCFMILHFLVYPASNGYNSYIDRDESSIGGLEKPPMPTRSLFYLTLLMDILAVMLSLLLVSKLFAVCVLIYILASRAYSSRLIRLKKHPIAGFLTVVFFQGAFTFFMCSKAMIYSGFDLSLPHASILLACSFQIAGAYPLTQIYQHKEDYADGVITLSYKLGYRGTFIFTGLMFVMCNYFYFLYFTATQAIKEFFILEAFFLPVILYFLYWFAKVSKNTRKADFKHTMRMNAIAATCMNVCFIILSIMH
jgi:1,4-dihydroxy-2-naphthoate octaprenyltransferase